MATEIQKAKPMAVLSQANVAQFTFELPGLAPDTFEVVDFRGEEQVSQLFRFEINVVSRDPDVDFTDVVNKPAVFTIHHGAEDAPICGIVADFEQSGRIADKFGYRAVLVPRLWWLTLTYQSRIFMNQSVDEIVRQVLTGAGLSSGNDFKLTLKSSYPPREYCTQFNETDFDFINRLLEYDGIHYYFVHDDQDTVIITDDRGASPTLRGESVLDYNPGAGLAAESEAVREFIAREHVVTGKHVVRDYHYERPGAFPTGESHMVGDMPGMRYEYGGGILDDETSKRLAKVRNEEIECNRRLMSGESNCNRMAPGHSFTIEGHYRTKLNGSYFVTAVKHQGSQEGSLSGHSGPPRDGQGPRGGPTYVNHFSCIPADAPFRPPRRTKLPKLDGVISAKVESGGGDYAYIDDAGRYHVKMPFDTGDRGNGGASLAVPATQINAGPDYGVHFPIHQQNDVIISFVGGDPNRPIIVGALATPANTSPSTGGNRSQNVIRTWGKNELTFDDTIGDENIYMFGTKDHTVEITNDENIAVGNDQSLNVGNDQTISVGNHRTKEVEANQSESIGGNKTIAVVGYHEETIGGSMTQTVNVASSELIGAAKTLSVGGALQITVGAVMNETVAGAKTEEVGAFKGEAIGGNKTEAIGGNKSLTTAGNLSVKVMKNRSLAVIGNVDEDVKGKQSVQIAKEYSVNAKKIQLMAEDQIVIKTGKSEITMKKSGDILIKGTKIQVKGSGDVILKGSKIKEN